MPDLQEQFDKITSIGREEIAFIAQGDVNNLSIALNRREKALQEFLEAGSKEQEDVFLDKLLQLKAMNAHLQNEARSLHQSLKEELLKLRNENRRMGGYRNGAIVIPLTSRFLNKKG